MISHRLTGRRIPSGEVSRCSTALVRAIENWRNRTLSLPRFKYLFCDDVYFELSSAMRKLGLRPMRFKFDYEGAEILVNA
jgi:hypothetical protein